MRLRRLRPDDAAALARLRNDRDVVRWSQPEGCTPEEAALAVSDADEARREGRRTELAIATQGVFRSRLPFGAELRDVVVFSRLRGDPPPR